MILLLRHSETVLRVYIGVVARAQGAKAECIRSDDTSFISLWMRLFVIVLSCTSSSTILGSGDQIKAIVSISNLGEKLEVGRTALLFVPIILGDVIMTSRTWLVWGRNYRVLVVPSIAIAGLVACGIGLLYELNMSPGDSLSAFADGHSDIASRRPSQTSINMALHENGRHTGLVASLARSPLCRNHVSIHMHGITIVVGRDGQRECNRHLVTHININVPGGHAMPQEGCCGLLVTFSGHCGVPGSHGQTDRTEKNDEYGVLHAKVSEGRLTFRARDADCSVDEVVWERNTLPKACKVLVSPGRLTGPGQPSLLMSAAHGRRTGVDCIEYENIEYSVSPACRG
ncbi:hypothetical protein C8Q70DRAFT_935716 [Cubamyces menziesii]|nr:hypothetical protein C8Q70DRAFT_935716 [Cubamyces menziesii]